MGKYSITQQNFVDPSGRSMNHVPFDIPRTLGHMTPSPGPWSTWPNPRSWATWHLWYNPPWTMDYLTQSHVDHGPPRLVPSEQNDRCLSNITFYLMASWLLPIFHFLYLLFKFLNTGLWFLQIKRLDNTDRITKLENWCVTNKHYKQGLQNKALKRFLFVGFKHQVQYSKNM